MGGVKIDFLRSLKLLCSCFLLALSLFLLTFRSFKKMLLEQFFFLTLPLLSINLYDFFLKG